MIANDKTTNDKMSNGQNAQWTKCLTTKFKKTLTNLDKPASCVIY